MPVGRLNIHLVEARNLPDSDLFGKIDPYVKLQIGPVKYKGQARRRAGCDPVFDEVVVVELQEGTDINTFICEVWDKDLLRDDFLGKCAPSLEACVLSGESSDRWYTLYSHQGKPRGEIRMAFSFERARPGSPTLPSAPVAAVPRPAASPPRPSPVASPSASPSPSFSRPAAGKPPAPIPLAMPFEGPAEEHKLVIPSASRVTCVDLHPAEPTLLLATAAGRVEAWDLSTKAKLFDVPGNEKPGARAVAAARFLGGGLACAVCDCDGRSLRILDLPAGTTAKVVETKHAGDIAAIAAHRTERTLVTAGADKSLLVWSGKGHPAWAVVRALEGHTAPVLRLAMSPAEGRATVLSAAADRSVRVWDLQLGTCKATLTEGGEVRVADFLAGASEKEKARVLLATGKDKAVKVYELQSQKLLRTLPTGEGAAAALPTAVASHASLPTVLAGCSDGAVRFYSAKSFAAEGSESYGLGAVTALAAARGTRFAVGHERGTVVVLDEALRYLEAELARIVGLNALKGELRAFVRDLRLNQRRAEAGFKQDVLCPHMLFFGNPGTGKTSVARLVPRLLQRIGLLGPGAPFVEANRQNLVGQYVGQTEKITGELVDKARGGVLFVDEAYRLTEGDSDKDFGKKAFESIMTEMTSDRKDRVIFIFAGYPQKMADFVRANEGMERRIGLRLHFQDYSPGELAEIARLKAEARQFKLADGCLAALPAVFERTFEPAIRARWNAGLADRCLDEAQRALNRRVTPESPIEQLMTLTLNDFVEGAGRLRSTLNP